LEDGLRKYLAGAGLNGAMGVSVGAWAAHGLQGRLSPEALEWMRTGASYQLWHAAALLGLAAVAVHHFSRLIAVAGLALGLGAFVFAGSLYLYAWTGEAGFALAMPVGGALMIAGWLAVLAAAFRVGAPS
jgi:uncharacterized membrane protein YgdD (TMEM256/DUF423 family)